MFRTTGRGLLSLLAVLASPLAPTALAEPWVPSGPTGVGIVTAIAAGRTAVYAATCNGVFRSDDGASSWHEAGLQRNCVLALAVDPRRAADTLYAIVDSRLWVGLRPEPDTLWLAPELADLVLWVSRDGGQTWAETTAHHGHSVVVDLTRPDTAYLAISPFQNTSATLEVTHDSGATWSRFPDAPETIFHQLAFDPRDGTLYATDPGNGFLHSYSGNSWLSLAMAVDVVATGSGSDSAVYAAGHENFCHKRNVTPWTCNAIPSGVSVGILEIAGPQPQTTRILLLRFSGVLASDDRGASFSPAAANVLGYPAAAALDPTRSLAYLGNDIGVFRSADNGQTWTNSSAGLSSMWVRALALDPATPSTIWAGGEGRLFDVSQAGPGIFRSTDAGQSWTSASAGGEPGYVFSLAVDPSNPHHLYTGGCNGIVEDTTDGGAHWRKSPLVSNGLGGFIHALAVDPASSSRVWAATYGALQRSNDGGTTWSTPLAHDIYALLFDPRRPNTIYAGSGLDESAFYYPYGTGSAVQTSHDGGATWSRAGNETENPVTALAIDPFSEDVLYAGTYGYAGSYGGGVLRSPDAGATWMRWDSGNLREFVWALVADPAHAGVLYLASWSGVYRSTDGGVTWDLFSEGLSPYGSLALAVSPDGRWLYAGTTGGGVFRRDLFEVDRDRPVPVTRRRPPTTVVRRE